MAKLPGARARFARQHKQARLAEAFLAWKNKQAFVDWRGYEN